MSATEKKYPQPVDTYIGVITPEGVIQSNKRKVPLVYKGTHGQAELTDAEVWEYGFSKAAWELCPDYRCGREKKHDLAEMLVCVTLGFLCGRTTIRRSLKWCKSHLEELRKHMKLKYGIASPSTITRMLCGIDFPIALS